MVNTISAISSAFYPVSNSIAKPSIAVLQAQLNQYQLNLSDWQHCASCKTPAGKAKIAEISAKIADIKASIEAATTARSNQANKVPDGNANANQNFSVANTAATVLATQGGVGSRLDVYA